MATSGDYFTDWRRDPIDNVFYPEEITAEESSVEIIAGTNGKRGFYLIEVPSPDYSVTITRTYYVDGGGNLVPDGSPPTYTQVTTAPSTNEYLVNYERGLIIVNADEYDNGYSLGSVFNVAYHGLGSQMNVRNTLYIETTALNTKVSRDGTLAMTGDLNTNSNKIINLANGTNSGDAVNKSQLDLKLNLSGGTMSGAIAMGSNQITGLANGTSANDAVNFSQLSANALFGTYRNTFVAGSHTISDNKKLFHLLLNSGGLFTFDFTGVSDTDGSIFYVIGSKLTFTPDIGIKINGAYAMELDGSDFDGFGIGTAGFYTPANVNVLLYKAGSTWYAIPQFVYP